MGSSPRGSERSKELIIKVIHGIVEIVRVTNAITIGTNSKVSGKCYRNVQSLICVNLDHPASLQLTLTKDNVKSVPLNCQSHISITSLFPALKFHNFFLCTPKFFCLRSTGATKCCLGSLPVG